MSICFIATGGTFDKIYFDAKSEFRIGDPQAQALLEEGNVDLDYRVVSALRRDSLDMTDDDRQSLRRHVETVGASRVVIIHGTDTMVETACTLLDVPAKTIVLTGAMQPARMRYTDAGFNLGFATAAVQLLQPGVYIAMNGRVFDPRHSRKNVAAHRFETLE